MHSLFIDSTSGLVVGLLDPKFNWVEYKSLDEKKPSEIIHFEIFNLLKKYNLELKNMRSFISSGPGSYTGMRLSEGLVQIFELSQMPVFSFYHFDVPRLSGIENGYWATNAFKGEVFVYNWNADEVKKELILKSAFTQVGRSSGYTLDNTDPVFSDLISTKLLIKNESAKLFSNVFEQKFRVPPYYFRTLDEEFR